MLLQPWQTQTQTHSFLQSPCLPTHRLVLHGLLGALLRVEQEEDAMLEMEEDRSGVSSADLQDDLPHFAGCHPSVRRNSKSR